MSPVFIQLYQRCLSMIARNCSLCYIIMTLTWNIINVKDPNVEITKYYIKAKCTRIAVLAYICIRYEPSVFVSLTSQPESVTCNMIFIADREIVGSLPICKTCLLTVLNSTYLLNCQLSLIAQTLLKLFLSLC